MPLLKKWFITVKINVKILFRVNVALPLKAATIAFYTPCTKQLGFSVCVLVAEGHLSETCPIP